MSKRAGQGQTETRRRRHVEQTSLARAGPAPALHAPLLNERDIPAGAGVQAAMAKQLLTRQKTQGNQHVLKHVVQANAHLALTKADTTSEPFPYEESRPITWHDFQGEPETKPYSALAGESIPRPKIRFNGTVSYDYSENVWKARAKPDPESFDIEAQWDPQKAWVRPGHENAALLEHEQGHFEIAGILARRIQKAMVAAAKRAEWIHRSGATDAAAQQAAVEAAHGPMDTLWLNGMEVFEFAKQRYDGKSKVGTDHGRRQRQQQQWGRWIKMGLPTFKVPMRVPKGGSE